MEELKYNKHWLFLMVAGIGLFFSQASVIGEQLRNLEDGIIFTLLIFLVSLAAISIGISRILDLEKKGDKVKVPLYVLLAMVSIVFVYTIFDSEIGFSYTILLLIVMVIRWLQYEKKKLEEWHRAEKKKSEEWNN